VKDIIAAWTDDNSRVFFDEQFPAEIGSIFDSNDLIESPELAKNKVYRNAVWKRP
jgi:hypothetical protein